MHEYGIVRSLLDRIDAEAAGRHAVAVHAITLKLGELSGVEPDLLAFAFEGYREGTICGAAELKIDRVPARWECPRCETELPRGGFLRCGRCNEPGRLVSGDEIVLERIEMEVADVS